MSGLTGTAAPGKNRYLSNFRIKSPSTNLMMFPSSLKVYQTLLRRYAIDPPLLSEVLTSTL